MTRLGNDGELRAWNERGIFLGYSRRNQPILFANDHKRGTGDAWQQPGRILALGHAARCGGDTAGGGGIDHLPDTYFYFRVMLARSI